MRVSNRLSSAQTLSLKRAILLYEGADECGEHQMALATVHPVHCQNAQFSLGAGVSLSRETLDQMIQELSAAPRKRCVLPVHLLSFDAALMAWHCPSRKYPIFFATRDQEFNTLFEGKQVWHPALLFVARPGSLFVYALKSDERPDETTKLFVAPYYNLWKEGKMCQGNSALPNSLDPAQIPLWERVFFETNFSHSNRDKVTAHQGGHNGLWKAMLSAKRFDCSSLLPLKQTMKDVIA